MPYSQQHILTLPAKPSSSLVRLALGVCAFALGVIVLNFFYYASLTNFLPSGTWPILAHELDTGSTPRAVLALLFSFLLIILALALALAIAHDRTVASLVGPPRAALRDFALACTALLVLNAGLAFVPLPRDMALEPGLSTSIWLRFLPLALLGLLIQISAEELVFRGYLQSQLAARFNHPAIWIVLPSVIFGALHYDPDVAGKNAALIALWAVCFGLAAADLTARTGTLGAACALHFSTNFSAILITSTRGSLDGLALYNYPFTMSDTAIIAQWLPVDALVLLCSWLTARLVLKR